MKFRRGAMLLALLFNLPASGAPLFSDLPDNHWARDTAASLAEKGLLQGYPGGRFLGDRAISRWELALLVARCLSRCELTHSTSSSRAELEELRQVAQVLEPELRALGVSLERLEEWAAQLDQRVSEVERIRFYGEFNVRGTTQSFHNQGSPQSDRSAPVLNYNRMVGSISGAGDDLGVGPAAALDFNPNFFGVLPVSDMDQGRLLTSGQGFSSRLMLGVRVNLDPLEDLTAGLELAAYTAQGNSVIDAYYGASAPYLSNPFTANPTPSDNNIPWSRMTLDHFWVRHGQSATTLTVGAFRATTFDPILYTPQPNPNRFGPRFLDNFGVQVRGTRVDLGEVRMDYEAMLTRLADGNEGLAGQSYFTHGEGASLGLSWRNANLRLNFLRAANEASGGAPNLSGLISKVNQANPIPWVNPSGFFAAQLGPLQSGGAASTSDIRPVPMPGPSDGLSGLPGVSNLGNFGPQDQTGVGFSSSYQFDGWGRPKVSGEWAHTVYKPNKNSPYSTSGSAFRFALGATIPTRSSDPDLALGLEAEYVNVDARYDPFVVQVPRQVGAMNQYRTPDFNYYSYLYPLHNTSTYPHNREGFRLKLEWDFSRDGHLELRYGNLRQKTTSLQDVRFSAGSLGLLTPNSDVLGFSPGFVDPVFGGLASQTFAPQGGNLLAQPLENPRGRSQNWGLRLDHRWPLENERFLRLGGGVQQFHFQRPSQLAALVGGSAGILGQEINAIDFTYRTYNIELGYDWTRALTTRLGYLRGDYRGHYDPFGVYGSYALTRGNTDFNNLDVTQHQPYLGFDLKVSDDVSLDAEFRYIAGVDHVPGSVFPTPTQPGLNLVFSPQYTAHPFNWSGTQISAGMSVKF